MRIPIVRCSLALLLSVAWSCASQTLDDEQPPDGALTRARTMPPGSVEISAEARDALMAAGNWMPVTAHTLDEAAELEERRDAEDQATIDEYLAANPEVGELIPADPAAEDPTVVRLDDGNFLHTIPIVGGETQVVTLGRRHWLRTIADAIRAHQSLHNQQRVFHAVYDALSEDWRNELSLPRPAEVEADPARTASSVLDLIKRVSDPGISASIRRELYVANRAATPPVFLSDCEQERGAVAPETSIGDLTGSKFDGTCDFSGIGIVRRLQWPLREHLTCVKSQGYRGTCTGFANTAAIETMVSRTHGARVNLSEQAYYQRARTVWDNPTGTIDGHMSAIGFREMHQEAFLLFFEGQWRYNPSYQRVPTCTNWDSNGNCLVTTYPSSCVGYNDTCSDTIHQSAFACAPISGWLYCGYYLPDKNSSHYGFRIGESAEILDPTDKAGSLELVKLFLVLQRPVVIGHPVTTRWDAAGVQGPHRGFIPYVANDTNRGGHGVLVIGYIDNEDLAGISPNAPPGAGGGYLIVKNSWSNCWGDGGFVYVPYQSFIGYVPDATVLFEVL